MSTVLTGTTLDAITSAGSDQSTATPITRNSNWNIVTIADGGGSSTGAILPSDAQIGDVVETHAAATLLLYPNVGSSIDDRSINASAVMGTSAGFTVRLMPDGHWARI